MSETTTQEGGSIRDSLAAAFDKQESPTPAAPAEAAPAPVAQPAEKPATGRDESGRFAPKAEKLPEVKPVETKPGEEAQKAEATPAQPAYAAPPPAATKPPASWTPAVREEWGKVPPAVQEYILKREGETARALSETAAARKFAQEFEQVAAPYKGLFTAPPVQVAANLFQTAAALQTGPMPTKAAIVASIMRDYGISGDAVADALEGKQGAQQAQPHGGQYRDPRVDQLVRQMEATQQRAQQALTGRAQQELEALASSGEAEFLGDVGDTMADLLEVAAKRGVALSAKDAYARAVQMHPEVATVLKQREDAKRAQTAQAATARAKAASSSVRNEPAAPGQGAQPNSLRGSLEAAFAAHTGR